MIKAYTYKIGDRVTFPTGKTAKVIARFHPNNNPQFNSYVVDLDVPQFSEAHDMRVHTVSVAECFLNEPACSLPPMAPRGFASWEDTPDADEPPLNQSINWVKWYRNKHNVGLYDAVQEMRKRQGFRQDHNPDPLV